MGKFWNGDVRLIKAYWVYGLLLPSGVALLLWLSGLELVPGSATAIIFGTTILAYLVFWGVGTWRSATKYTGPKVWAILTKIHLALPLVGLALTLVISLLLPQKSTLNEQANSPSTQPRNNVPVTAPDQPMTIAAPTEIPPLPAIPPSAATHSNSKQPAGEKNGHLATRKQPARTDYTLDDFLAAGYRVPQKEEPQSESTPAREPASNLGWLDKMRYESCQQDAAKAPTPHGVNVGLRICREKFNQ